MNRSIVILGGSCVFDARLSQALAKDPVLHVINAAGPFQASGNEPYRLARAALAACAHCLALSDDADFTAGITVLDATARCRNGAGAGRRHTPAGPTRGA